MWLVDKQIGSTVRFQHLDIESVGRNTKLRQQYFRKLVADLQCQDRDINASGEHQELANFANISKCQYCFKVEVHLILIDIQIKFSLRMQSAIQLALYSV